MKALPQACVGLGLWEPSDLPGEGSHFTETGDKVRQSLGGGCQGHRVSGVLSPC